jgi:acetylornithine/succinyldiaminopimelate/putrescine aminotransferase
VIGFTGGFHGRTYAALSLMDKPLYKDGMGPFLPNTLVLPFNDVDALESRVDENTCAVMIEFLQGEGGIQSATQEFVDALFALKETYGFLVIADEVQSGIGRTGDFFSFEKYGVRPDIITVAKAMGGGLPLGAILATEEAASLLDKGMHGTTYGGNPVACVAGSVVVEEVCNGLMAHVKEIGDYLNAQLEAVRSEFPEQIREIRGRGCMQGVVVHTDAAPYVQELLKNGVIANATAGNVIRLVPPFIITTADVDELVRALRTVMSVTRG